MILLVRLEGLDRKHVFPTMCHSKLKDKEREVVALNIIITPLGTGSS